MKRFILTILAVVLAVNVGFCEVLKGEVSYDAKRARAEAFAGLEKTIDMRRFSSFEKDYDYAVINDTVEQAVLDIEAILAAEKLRVSREKDIEERILNHA